ncbi:serine/threonine protein kinase [Mycobacterium sp. pR1184]|uniref:serine/threonine protein kinase n=1 Tax=Mycobacterium sp. pR1184 TaxID=3238981 RepID=UPI00351BCBD3
MPAERFGKYQLLRPLSRGRCEVYEAEDTTTRQRVALKIFPRRDSVPPVPMRVQREAGMATRVLTNTAAPHWVLIDDAGEIDGRLYLQMPLIESVDLRTLLARQGPLTPARAVEVLGQVAAAVDTAHAAGLVSREIATENILIARDGVAYLLCRPYAPPLTDAGQPDETPSLTTGSIPPEQVAGTVDDLIRAATYSLACILYECLTGAPPFPGDAREQVIGHLTKDPPEPSYVNPAVPPTFDGVIARGMVKKPKYRYASGKALTDAAHAALQWPADPPRKNKHKAQ